MNSLWCSRFLHAQRALSPACYGQLRRASKRASFLKPQTPIPSNLSGSELLYGVASLQAALQQGKREVFCIYTQKEFLGDVERRRIDDIVRIADQQDIPVIPVKKERLDKTVAGSAHQGVIMKASMFKYSSMTSLSRFENGSYHVNTADSKIVHQPRGRLPLWVLLDGIQDPRNMGSIIRSAFFFGADAVMIPSRLSCKPTPAVSRTSSGAMECLPIYRATRVDRVLKEAKASGWAVISTATVGGLASKLVAPSDIPPLTKPTVLVIGSEEKGVSEKVAPLSDINVHIPAHAELPGHLDSLNAGVAAGIILSNLKVHA